MRVTPLGLCLKVIVNEKPPNIEKTTSGVLSVWLLICGYDRLKFAILEKKIFLSVCLSELSVCYRIRNVLQIRYL